MDSGLEARQRASEERGSWTSLEGRGEPKKGCISKLHFIF